MLFVGCNQPKANGENKTTEQSTSLAAGSTTSSKAASAITVVNWNIEWLGSTSNGPKNKTLQLQNAIKILQYLKADIYCLCEIVDPASLKKLTTSLGSDYAYALSSYSSGAGNNRDQGYPSAQKLAFIFNTRRFKNVRTKGYLQDKPNVGFYFASGRYPFDLEATIQTPEVAQKVDFMIIHAKSGADRTSYERRLNAATALKASLEKDKAGQAVMLLGDFNDHVNGSITSGMPSPYNAFVADPTYHVLTFDLAGERSTLDYPGVIDQQIVSQALNRYYLAGSVRIRTDITTVVPDYKKGNTSDHYPVSSVFIFDKAHAHAAITASTPPTNPNQANPEDQEESTQEATAEKAATETSIDAPQRLQQRIFTAGISTGSILVRASVKSQHIQFILYNKRQHKVVSVHRKFILKGENFRIKTPNLYKGDYTLVIFSDHGKQVIPFTIQ